VHEAGLVRAAVAALADAAGGRPVRSVVLAVGAGVDVDSAAAAWQVAAAGTGLEHASVTWRRCDDRLRCFSCGREYDGDALARCPSCGDSGIVVARAAEIGVAEWAT
jgi:Zn finger protein HypA/HybF involved in hydrogenase expression